MKTFSSAMRTLPLLLALATVGCGGALKHLSQSGDDSSAEALTLTAGDAYNGSTVPLLGTNTGTASADTLAIRVKKDGRELLLSLPVASVAQGETFRAGQTGVAATYEETTGTSTKSWKATAGSLVVSKLSGKKVSFDISGLSFATNEDKATNAAAGSFTLYGDLENVSVTTGSTIPSNPVLTFSDAVGTNAYTTGFGTDAVATFDETVVTNVSLFTTDDKDRVLAFNYVGQTALGQTFDLAAGDPNVALNYAQNRDGTQNWKAVSGTVTVTAKTATTITLKIANAKFQPNDDGALETARGTFTINGELKKA